MNKTAAVKAMVVYSDRNKSKMRKSLNKLVSELFRLVPWLKKILVVAKRKIVGFVGSAKNLILGMVKGKTEVEGDGPIKGLLKKLARFIHMFMAKLVFSIKRAIIRAIDSIKNPIKQSVENSSNAFTAYLKASTLFFSKLFLLISLSAIMAEKILTPFLGSKASIMFNAVMLTIFLSAGSAYFNNKFANFPSKKIPTSSRKKVVAITTLVGTLYSLAITNLAPLEKNTKTLGNIANLYVIVGTLFSTFGKKSNPVSSIVTGSVYYALATVAAYFFGSTVFS